MKLISYTILGVLFVFIICKKAPAQQEVSSVINNYIQALRHEDKHSPAPAVIYDTEQPGKALGTLKAYYNDTLTNIRHKAYYLTYKVGLNNKELAPKAVNQLIYGLKDESSGLVGSVLNYLDNFKARDFNKEARESIEILLERKTPHYKKLIKIAGFLELSNNKELLKNKLRTRDYNSASEKWTILLALARMGDQDAIEYCLTIAEQMKKSDDFVYEIAPDLIYTRQKELTDYLLTILFSDEKQCSSPNPEFGERIRCGYRIMEYMAPVVKDFPLQTDVAGQIETDDYRSALEQTREWFKMHREDYELYTNVF